MKKAILRKIDYSKEKYAKELKKRFPSHKYELILLDEEGKFQSRTPGKYNQLFVEASGMGREFIYEK